MTPKVTIIFTSLDPDKSAEKAIQCIEDSYYRNIELIVIHDGKENVSEFLMESNINNPVFIEHKDLDSAASLLNKTARMASGRYLMFIDSRSYLYPDGIVSLTGRIKGDIVAVTCKSEVYVNGNESFYPKTPPHFNDKQYTFSNPFSVPFAKIVSASAFKQINGFDESLKYDILCHWDLDLRLLEIGKFAYTDNNIGIRESFSPTIPFNKKTELYKKFGVDFSMGYEGEKSELECVPEIKLERIIIKPEEIIYEKPISKKVLFYTSITGSYDDLIEQLEFEHNLECKCFTDNHDIKSDKYDVHYLQNNMFSNNYDGNIRKARYVKLQLHKLMDLSKYEYVVWVDARIKIKKNIDEFLEKITEEFKLGMFDHNERNCLYNEMDWIAIDKLDRKSILVAQKLRYKKDGFPFGNGLFSTGILMYVPCKETEDFFDIWHNEIENGSRRCQASFTYALEKSKLKFISLGKYLQPQWKKHFTLGSHPRLKASIVIATYKDGKNHHLQKCLDSINKNTRVPFDTIIIDTKEPRISVAEAWNKGIEKAKGEIIVLLNDDTLVTFDWIEDMKLILLSNEEYGVVSPTLSHCATKQKDVLKDIVNGKLKEDQVDEIGIDINNKYDGDIEELKDLCGACLMFRKSLYDEVGKFESMDSLAYGEENDWLDRVIEKGYKLIYAKGVLVYHAGGETRKRVNDVDPKKAKEKLTLNRIKRKKGAKKK